MPMLLGALPAWTGHAGSQGQAELAGTEMVLTGSFKAVVKENPQFLTSQLKNDQQWCERTTLSLQEDPFIMAINFYDVLISQLYQDKLHALLSRAITVLHAYGLIYSRHIPWECRGRLSAPVSVRLAARSQWRHRGTLHT